MWNLVCLGMLSQTRHGEVEETELLRTYHGYISLISCFMGGNIKGI